MKQQETSTILPRVSQPSPTENIWARPLKPANAFDWLSKGWQDFRVQTGLSLIYGGIVYLISVLLVFTLFAVGWGYILFPAFAGFMVVGPILGLGLYEKSRRLEAHQQVTLARMIFVKAESGGQILFTGVLLCLLVILWMRAAVLIYALFFGLLPFPGLDHIVPMLFATGIGWSMLLVGSAVGGLFAAFSFAISALSIPMLLSERTDALTAMGSSMALVWNNLRTMLTWAAIVLVLFLLSVATGLLGLIIVYPLLGHGTWHAYRAVKLELPFRREPNQSLVEGVPSGR